MKLKFIGLFMPLLLLVSLVSVSAFAADVENAGPGVLIDEAGVLSDANEQKLQTEAETISQQYGIAPYTLLIQDTESDTGAQIVSSYLNDISAQAGDDLYSILVVSVANGEYSYHSNLEGSLNQSVESAIKGAYGKLQEGHYTSFIRSYYEATRQALTETIQMQEQEALQEIDIDYVMDTADLLTEGEEAHLREMARQIAEEESIATYILTVSDYRMILDTENCYDAATHFFQEHDLGYGEGHDGVLLLLSMQARDYAYIVTGEKASSVFDEDTQIDIESYFLDEFAEDQWFEGFEVYLQQTEFEIQYGWMSNLFALIIIVLISFSIALLAGFTHKSKLKSVKLNRSAMDYIKHDSSNVQVKEDVFTHTTETRVKISKEGNSRGGSSGGRSFSGGGFSGRSGKF